MDCVRSTYKPSTSFIPVSFIHGAVKKLSGKLSDAGVEVPPLSTATVGSTRTNGSNGGATAAKTSNPEPQDPEDFWSPVKHVPDGVAFQVWREWRGLGWVGENGCSGELKTSHRAHFVALLE